MAISFKRRKIGYTLLFASILFLQLVLLYVWREKNQNQQKMEAAFAQKNRSSLALDYFDHAVYHFFDAESAFNAYFQDYNPGYLRQYRASILTMSSYIDSLQALTVKNQHMHPFLKTKQKTEDSLLVLKKKLDRLINLQIVPLSAEYHSQKELSQNTDPEIKSLHYDIIKMSNNMKKQRLLSRIIDAIRNKGNYNKEELIIYLSKVFDTKMSSANKDNLKTLFLATDNYYTKQFNSLKGTYKNLKSKDKELILVNRYIIDNCQEIISGYNSTLKDIDNFNYSSYQKENNSQSNMIMGLLTLILALTIALLIYTWHAYDYGKKLITAKAEIQHNLDFKNRIIGMLSHEMKAPLNIISNFTQRIKNDNKDSGLSETVDSLLFTSNSLQITVSQILNFFKNENSKLVLYKSEIELEDEIQSIIQSLQSLAETKKLQLNLAIRSKTGVKVLADSGKIHQLFYNIIGNAIKFTDKGSISVACKTTKVKDQIRLDVTIKDTGIGIPPDDLKHIFNPYYQSQNDSNKISLGAGLGLNLCREIITLHKGEIEVKSEINHGTEISFFLLLEMATDKTQSNKIKLLNHLANQKVSVAFVDDDVMTTAILKKFLDDVGFASSGFNSANEIKSYLEINPVDLILTDLHISGYSGMELIYEIKKLKNQNAKAPIIIITGNDYAGSYEKTNEVIIKPIDREELYSKLIKVLQVP